MLLLICCCCVPFVAVLVKEILFETKINNGVFPEHDLTGGHTVTICRDFALLMHRDGRLNGLIYSTGSFLPLKKIIKNKQLIRLFLVVVRKYYLKKKHWPGRCDVSR